MPKSNVSCHASPCSASRPRGREGSTTTGSAKASAACGSTAGSSSAATRTAGADWVLRRFSLVSRDVVMRTTAA